MARYARTYVTAFALVLQYLFILLWLLELSSSLSTSSSTSGSTLPLIDFKEPRAIYVHIPFCRKRCYYCDFAVTVVGDQEEGEENDNFLRMTESYSAAVIEEISLIKKSYGVIRPALDSIYFGGGTPSVAPTKILRDILDAIRDNFIISDGAEITIEMDPGTFSTRKLQSIVQMGFNRVSLGVQSFDDSLLEGCGRIHRSRDVYEAVQILRDGGIQNFSLDLISGLPGLTLGKWAETLEIASSLSPNHISCYDLQIEESTPFFKLFGEDETVPKISKYNRTGELPDPTETAFMYKYASGYLRSKGYEHYEISSYGKPHFWSRHNKLYWEFGANWFAAGCSASSSLNGFRFARPRSIADYCKWVNSLNLPAEISLSTQLPWQPSVNVDRNDVLSEVLLSKLRTRDGLDLTTIQTCFGDEIVGKIIRGSKLALDLGFARIEDNVLKLTDPEGFLFSNSIISSIYVEIGLYD